MYVFSKENIWSNPHSCIHPDKYNNSVDRIISKEEEREDPRRDSSIFSPARIQECSSNSTRITRFLRTTVFPHAIQQLQDILHTELILLQEFSKKYYNYKAHPVSPPCRLLQGILQRLFPVHPSILHGRIKLQAP